MFFKSGNIRLGWKWLKVTNALAYYGAHTKDTTKIKNKLFKVFFQTRKHKTRVKMTESYKCSSLPPCTDAGHTKDKK